MKKEDLFAALGDMDPRLVGQAREYRGRIRRAWRKWAAIAACAAILAGLVWGAWAVNRGGGKKNGGYPAGVTAMLAVYPEPIGRSLSIQEFTSSKVYRSWLLDYRKLTERSAKLQGGMEEYNFSLMGRLLTSDRENTVCSPLNTWFAFAMLAELTEGDTRRQLLELLGEEDMDALRENVSALWESNYADTPMLKSLLANSLWLDEERTYREDTLERLVETYRASVFSGTPGAEAMNEALRKWTDENTGGLLREYTGKLALHPDTVLELVSTIYFKARWLEHFREASTTKETFHGTLGDSTVDMMHRTAMLGVYWGESFTAVGLPLIDSGSMYFLLPEEGTDVNDLLADPEILAVLRADGTSEKRGYPNVHLSVPRFRVTGSRDLRQVLADLGVTDVLDPALADFSPLTEEEGAYLGPAQHTALLEIDEEGVTGAAYTALGVTGAALMPEEEIDFVLDRPFLFLVTGRDGSLLFSGAVRNLP